MNSFCFMLSLKICLTISLVSSSHAWMSSALIPLLFGDLPFFEFVDCSSQLFCRDLSDSRHLIGVDVMHIDAALIFILSDFLFRFFLFIVVETLTIPFRDVMMSPFSFFILVMSTLFVADLIPAMFFTPLKSSSILWMSCCLFHSFLSLILFF